MRSPACPSHSGGTAPALPSPARIASTPAATASASSGSNVFVPTSTVLGRSVLGRSVRHGTPSAVVSSWIPPESVTTTAARSMSARKSR